MKLTVRFLSILFVVSSMLIVSCDKEDDDVPAPCDIEETSAGTDILGEAGVTQVTLAAEAAPSRAQGQWSVVSGDNGSFADDKAASTAFIGHLGVSYTLRWTVSKNSTCSATDEVHVLLASCGITADAGEDIPLLSGTNRVDLGAAPLEEGQTGLWSVLEGEGYSFDDNTDPNTSFSGNRGATYTLQWKITSGLCESVDQVRVSFSAINPTGISARTGHAQDLLTITGTGLLETTNVLMRDDQSTYSLTPSSVTETEVQFSISNEVPAGDYSVLLTTASGGFSQLPGGFSVLPTFTTFVERSGDTADRIIISGASFGRNPDRIQIHFRTAGTDFSTPAESCTDNQIVFIIPSIPPGSYSFNATINGKDMLVRNPYYIPAGRIANITPRTVAAGEVITITGHSFFNNGFNARLSLDGPSDFNNIPSISNSATSLSFRVPADAPDGRYDIRVRIDEVAIAVPEPVRYITVD